MRSARMLAALAACAPLLAGCLTPPDAAALAASAGGTGPDDAIVVSSAAQKSEILRILGLELQSQALHTIDGRAFDVLQVRHGQTGEIRAVWFDISRIYGRGD